MNICLFTLIKSQPSVIMSTKSSISYLFCTEFQPSFISPVLIQQPLIHSNKNVLCLNSYHIPNKNMGFDMSKQTIMTRE